MEINNIGANYPFTLKIEETSKNVEQGNVFSDLIKNVIENQSEASRLTSEFSQGKDVELHEVMLAGEKAKTSFELLMEIRNKALDMYKEITRMQI